MEKKVFKTGEIITPEFMNQLQDEVKSTQETIETHYGEFEDLVAALMRVFTENFEKYKTVKDDKEFSFDGENLKYSKKFGSDYHTNYTISASLSHNKLSLNYDSIAMGQFSLELDCYGIACKVGDDKIWELSLNNIEFPGAKIAKTLFKFVNDYLTIDKPLSVPKLKANDISVVGGNGSIDIYDVAAYIASITELFVSDKAVLEQGFSFTSNSRKNSALIPYNLDDQKAEMPLETHMTGGAYIHGLSLDGKTVKPVASDLVFGGSWESDYNDNDILLVLNTGSDSIWLRSINGPGDDVALAPGRAARLIKHQGRWYREF